MKTVYEAFVLQLCSLLAIFVTICMVYVQMKFEVYNPLPNQESNTPTFCR